MALVTSIEVDGIASAWRGGVTRPMFSIVEDPLYLDPTVYWFWDISQPIVRFTADGLKVE